MSPGMQFKSKCFLGLPWWSRVENPPSNARDVGLIPGRGTSIPHALEQLNLNTATREEAPCATVQSLHAATKSSQKKKEKNLF